MSTSPPVNRLFMALHKLFPVLKIPSINPFIIWIPTSSQFVLKIVSMIAPTSWGIAAMSCGIAWIKPVASVITIWTAACTMFPKFAIIPWISEIISCMPPCIIIGNIWVMPETRLIIICTPICKSWGKLEIIPCTKLKISWIPICRSWGSMETMPKTKFPIS